MTGKTIVLATDGSRSAEKALDTAIDLARASGRPLRIVSVWSPPVSGFGYGIVPIPELAQGEIAKAQRAIDVAMDAARAAGVSATSTLRKGYPVEGICEAAEDTGAGLIVIGAHGWGRLKRLFLGSVSSGVLQHASCPVLVVRDLQAGESHDTESAELRETA
jgi:nucleotide-binding universal stress UspA family protein